ncbi:MAG: glycoside hydrolase family 3 C-terminal domain-containing protein [Planctomycetota bacterium]|jgi:beta-glucosidase
MRTLLILLVVLTSLIGCASQPPYKNTQLPVDQRVKDLVSRMTLEEKVAQMSHLAPAIERLGIREYGPNFNNPLGIDSFEFEDDEAEEYMRNRPWENLEYWDVGSCQDGGWWNEALHGVARAGLATAFPQSIGLGSTWNPELIQKMTDVASTEARIHNQTYGKKLTYWSPTINILRDPRWGRTEESYSEDPYLLSRMAVAFVKGFQGDDPKYLKAIATLKHFVANNSEYNRHNGSADVSERFLREYYLYAFQAGITEGGAFSVMSAYNAINGVPASANNWLLDDVLRGEWGFRGYVVSDCGAVSDIVHGHEYETDPEKAVALAAIAGTDLECETCETEQFLYDKYLLNAARKGYITEKDIDKNVTRLFRARFLLGEFDPPHLVPYSAIPKSKLDCQEHRDLALQIAKESIVLLKNEKNALPLNRKKIKSIAVIGPNANRTVLGGYSGSPSVSITPLQGLKDEVKGKIKIHYSEGCNVMGKEEIGWDQENDRPVWKILDERKSISDAAKLAGKSDLAIVFAGTNLDVANEAADRTDLGLPGNQLKLIQEVYKANPNTVVVLISGMALTINWVNDNIPAIVEAWYPGQAGGAAIADVLFGDYNPGGKLPVTFYKRLEDLPSLGDYDITKGHAYWFNKKEPLYPFGHGLSYTTFKYENLRISKKTFNPTKENKILISVDIQNTGPIKGDEVVQLYIKDLKSSVIQPLKKLRKFKRITLGKGEAKKVTFELSNDDFAYWSEKKKDWHVEDGTFEIQIGSSSADIKLKKLITAAR